MKFQEQFKLDYEQWFREMSAKQLVKYIRNIEQYIDSDLFEDSLLADEMLILYDLSREECIHRVSKMAECDWTQLA